ncbi:MAG: heme A synthase [Legionella sp.]|nr:heme A synthase [Legionella sp.]
MKISRNIKLKQVRWVASFALVLALGVVMLGAYTRLTDAGLGCPDWPGCYGKMVLPSASAPAAHAEAQNLYPDIPIESHKAWTEMAHRYIAGTFGLLILFLAAMAWKGPHTARTSLVLPAAMLAVLIFQAALGMWTVTLKLLPVVVMGHLLGGLTLLSLLTCLRWQWSRYAGYGLKPWRVWVILGLFIVIAQIALGGWVSANYAGVACIGFPQCNRHWLPMFDWQNAFNLFSPLGANYQGGALDQAARVTIQWTHRVGAILTVIYVGILAGCMLRRIDIKLVKIMAGLALMFVFIQCSLGIMNVVYLLPLPISVAHNGVAALLLVTMVSLCYLVMAGGRRVNHRN